MNDLDEIINPLPGLIPVIFPGATWVPLTPEQIKAETKKKKKKEV